MAKKFTDKAFDEATKLKLEIFGECFREWLPVFIHNIYTPRLFIYDFFAGNGKDINGSPGSPLVLLNEAKGTNCKICSRLHQKEIVFGFNDKNEGATLKEVVENYLLECRKHNCKQDQCNYQVHFGNYDFKQALDRENVKAVLSNNNYAKFLVLDQFGFSQIDQNVFAELVNYPKTDFIFFIASSYVKRFKDHPYLKKYIDTTSIDFDEIKPKEIHRRIASHYESLLGQKEFYIHHFSLKKGANYYGLIFGSGHTLGMEKFLKICWSKDKYAGESTENINEDYEEGTLFYDEKTFNKITEVKNEIRSKVLNHEISDNITGLKYALKKRCLPKIFTETILELESEERIKRTGDVNNCSYNIHRINKYHIKVL